MRGDDALLLDMLIAARKIQRFVKGMTLAEFKANDMAQSAVIRELQVIGEAARMITDSTRATCTEIDWRAIAGMRNRLVHEVFFDTDECCLEDSSNRYIPADSSTDTICSA